MTQVDFYVLANAAPAARLQFACRLVEKAWRLDRQVYLHAADAAAADELDQWLWRFRSDAFIPHRQVAAEGPAAPVLIGWQEAAMPDHNDVLINLAGSVPAAFGRFRRTSEIVVRTPEMLETARERWRFYHSQGCDLNSHDIPG